MEEGKLKAILIKMAEEAIPTEVDLWLEMRDCFAKYARNDIEGESLRAENLGGEFFATKKASRLMSLRGEFFATKQSHILRVAGAILFVCILILAVVLATPGGRAWANNALLFFLRSKSNTLLIPTQDPANLIEVPQTVTAFPEPIVLPDTGTLSPFHQECGSLPYPRCSLVHLSNMLDFPVTGLSEAPDGFDFTGATGGPDQAVLLYQGEGGALYLAQGPVDRVSPGDFEIAADAEVEAVFIDGLPGEYLQGGWAGLGILEPGEVGWEYEPGKQTLRWEQAGILYTLWYYPSKSADQYSLDKSQLVELASQITDRADKLEPPLPSQFLSMEQVETRSGFTPIQPAWLPEGYTLAGASYAPDRNAVCLHYRYFQEAASTLTLFQSYGWLPTIEDIKITSLYQGQPIDIPVSITTVPVGGSENGVATLAINGVNLGQICGGVELTTNKALLWRADGMNFILGAVLDQFQGRGFLSNLEMGRVAESLSGVPNLQWAELDPERITSLQEIKSIAGFPVRLPTRMLADLRFDHAVYRASGSADNPFRDVSAAEEVLLIYLARPLGDGKDGRHFNLFIAQSYGPGQQTLEEQALAGGYQWVTVQGNLALFRQDCWDDTSTGGFAVCMQTLSWMEGDLRIDIEAFLDKAIPLEMMLKIAEGLR